MEESILRAHKKGKWAVMLRMDALPFGWSIMKAGEQRIPVSTWICQELERMAKQDLQKGGPDDAA